MLFVQNTQILVLFFGWFGVIFCQPTTNTDEEDSGRQCVRNNDEYIRSLMSPQQHRVQQAIHLLEDNSRQLKRVANATRALEHGMVDITASQTEIQQLLREVKENANISQETNSGQMERVAASQSDIQQLLVEVKNTVDNHSMEDNSRDMKHANVSEALLHGMVDITASQTEIQQLMAQMKETVDSISVQMTFANAEPQRQLALTLTELCIPLLIQQNVDDGSDFFNRSWSEFKVGFKGTNGNYWLGNDILSQLTVNGTYKLRFDLQAQVDGSWYYAEYSTFIISSEESNYTLRVAGYSGNAGDAFSRHNGEMFTTYDRDNDLWTNSVYNNNCAVLFGGGFWYKSCGLCRVNARWLFFEWYGLPGDHLQASRMWLLCKQGAEETR